MNETTSCLNVFRTIIVPAVSRQAAQEVAPGCFTSGLSADGAEPATHYIASGYLPMDQVDAIALLEGVDVSEEEPFAAMGRLGLRCYETALKAVGV